jgi:hypothetical protein
MKICALLIPKELKVETVGRIGQLTDEQLDQAIAVLEEMIDRKSMGAIMESSAVIHPDTIFHFLPSQVWIRPVRVPS